jgi:hypothetical protein
MSADDELQVVFLRFHVRPHHAGERAFVGDRKRRVAQLVRARHQLLGMRCAAEEAEIGEAVQLGVGHGRGECTRARNHSALRKHAVHEPLPAAISIQPQRFAAFVAADEIIAADVLAVPPAALDALGT